MTPEQAATLQRFRWGEFHHPDLVDFEAAQFLDRVRQLANVPIHLTSDARTPEENAAASGSSPTSLHLLGRAFDFLMPDDPTALWALNEAVAVAKRAAGVAVEWELVHGPTDHHCHLGLYPDPWHPSKLELALT